MNQKIRRVHAPVFKARVALEAIKETKTIAELSSFYKVHSSQIIKWKKQALDGLTQIFSDCKHQKQKDNDDLIQELYRHIGRLKVEVEFLKKRWAYFRVILQNSH